MTEPVDAAPEGDERSTDRTTPASAAHLLMTLLGDYWFGTDEHVPSAAIVALLAEFDVGEDAVRAALSRLCKEGRLERVKDGRRTSYRSSAETQRKSARRGRALLRFGAEPIAWDGQWTCLAFSIPEADRHLRSSLRHRLRTLGMGPLFDGLWISPHPLHERVTTVVADLGVVGAAVFRSTEVACPQGANLVDAWDLVGARSKLDAFAKSLAVTGDRLATGAIVPDEALIARTEIMSRWRSLAMTDPKLPDELLPADWPLPEVRRRFVEVYDALGPLSEERVRRIVGGTTGTGERSAATGDQLPRGPRHHRLADLE